MCPEGVSTFGEEAMNDASQARTDAEAYDAEWQKAMGAGDIVALRGLVRPDALFVHQDGRFETGRAYLDRTEQGAGPRIVEFALAAGLAVRLGDTVVLTGKVQATVAQGEERRPLAGSVTRTWAREGSRWNLVATVSSGR
jgi:ketosteroid isomerase-like protein